MKTMLLGCVFLMIASMVSHVSAEIAETCPQQDSNVRIEQIGNPVMNQTILFKATQSLAIPLKLGSAGTVKRIALSQPGHGESIRKTLIISRCPGVYNPEAYEMNRSVDVCVITGRELTFSIIAGQKRSDYPVSEYRCVLKPKRQYFINLFHRDAGYRPPFSANKKTTCRFIECGIRISIF